MALWDDLKEAASTVRDLMDIAFVDVEGWFYGPLDTLGLPRPVETVLMAVVLALFMIVVVRMTGGVARLLLGVLLMLLLWHLVRPLIWV